MGHYFELYDQIFSKRIVTDEPQYIAKFSFEQVTEQQTAAPNRAQARSSKAASWV